jgi:hypothetical protein
MGQSYYSCFHGLAALKVSSTLPSLEPAVAVRQFDVFPPSFFLKAEFSCPNTKTEFSLMEHGNQSKSCASQLRQKQCGPVF